MRTSFSFVFSVSACLLLLNTARLTADVSASDSVAELPLFFQKAPGRDAFLASAQDSQVLVQASAVDIFLAVPAPDRDTFALGRSELSLAKPVEVRSIRMNLAGARPGTSLSGVARLGGRLNYISGDSAECQKDLPLWSQVKAENVYQGIDITYYGNGTRLEYDFQIAPGASPEQIKLSFEGVDSVSISENGDLLLKTGSSEIRQHSPVIYQVVDGKKARIEGAYQLASKTLATFAVGSYRSDLPLVIDPVLNYSTYFGGNAGDLSMVIRRGPDGSLYIAGQTLSRKFLFTRPEGAFQSSFHGGTFNGDAFVAKFTSTGSDLVYFTYLGGGGDDGAFDLAVDAAGNAFVTGFTTSPNFPVRNALYPRIHGGRQPELNTFNKDAFVCELDASGSHLIYSTYLGGSGSDVAVGIAVGADGSASVMGTTVSSNFPVLNPIPGEERRSGGLDCFITKLASGGGSLVFSTFFGGRRSDSGQGIAQDSHGNIYLTGYTTSPDFPITNAFQTRINGLTNNNGASDAWVAKLNSGGSLLYSTFLGATSHEIGYRVAVDPQGDAAYVTGYTQSRLFPNTLTNVPGLTNARAARFANADAFLSKITVDQSGFAQLAYSTVFGGYGSDVGWDLAISPAGDAYVVGVTTSSSFPTNKTSEFLRPKNSGGADAFVMALSADATTLLYSGYIGGSRADYGYGIALDDEGNAYLTGRTLSTNFPTLNPMQEHRYGGNDAFISIVGPP